MFILVTVLLLFLLAFALVILRWLRPEFQYAWLVAASGALIVWVSILTWQFRLPLILQFPRWQPDNLFLETLSFTANMLTWPFAFSLASLTLAVILTAPARENFLALIPWAATFVLGGLGVLAVLADTPLTLLMIWAAIDLVELIAQLRSVDNPQSSEKVVTAFAARVAGIGMLLWANMVSVANGTPLNFNNASSQTGLYLLIAAGLRLGVFPLHLPYASESAVRRGFGSMLRLVSATSSLILLARIPSTSVQSMFTPFLLLLTGLSALYGGWMWLRTVDDLSARPFWLIGLASIAMAAALHGNPIGAAAWSIALLLSGGALFLASAYQTWLNRILWIGLWGISALPLSLAASGWETNASSFWPAWPLLVLAQGLLLAGYYLHAARPTPRDNFETLDHAAKYFYPLGIGILLTNLLLLGVWGWNGALHFGFLLPALFGVGLSIPIIWITPRLQLLTPVRAHRVNPASTVSSWMGWVFRGLWSMYRLLGQISHAVSAVLEGDGGIMWTLLFLVLFISLLAQRQPTP